LDTAMAKSYEDIGKDCVEFITKGFPNAGTVKITAETKTPNGVSTKATGTRSFDYKESGTEEKLSAEVEPKFKHQDIEFSGKLSTLGEFEGGVAFEHLGTKGTKASFQAIQSDKDGTALKGHVAFKNDTFTTKAGLKYPFTVATHANWNGEVTFRHDNIHAGVDVRFDQDLHGEGKNRNLVNVKGGYIDGDQHFIVSVENQINKDKKTSTEHPLLNLFNVNYLYHLSSILKFGFGASVERANLKGTELHVSTEYKVDKDTSLKSKFSFVQAKTEDREFRLAFAAKQNVTERVNVAVGADINARQLFGVPGGKTGASKPHSFGFEVKFQ